MDSRGCDPQPTANSQQCGGSSSNENENEIRTFLKPYTKMNFK